MYKKRQEDTKAEVDLTPMLDVVFILLIFFVVTATFISEKSLAIHTPQGNVKQTGVTASVVITVNEDEQFYLEGRKIDKRALRALLAQKKAENNDASFVLRAHENASTASFVWVADAVREIHGGQVSLISFSD